MIGKQFGPFDIAFLPINGARMGGDPAQETPAVLTPAQASRQAPASRQTRAAFMP